MKQLDIQSIVESDNLIGVVVDNNDPNFSGRCKVKVYGVFDNIENYMLPWATPINSSVFGANGGGSLSVPKIGTIVRISFSGGDIYAPEYTCIQNIDEQLISKLKDDYIGAHVLLYDMDANLNVIYQQKSGFEIFYNGSYINISPDSMITIQHNNGESTVQLKGGQISIGSKEDIKITSSALIDVSADEVKVNGKMTTKVGPGPYTPAVMSDVLWGVLSQLATNIDAKFPSTPGVNMGLVKMAMNGGGNSTNVLISK